MIRNILIALFALSVISCQPKTADIPDFDEVVWKEDINGCSGKRAAMSEQLDSHREVIKGLNQDEVVELLGKPDKNELYKRNQKFFIYEISNAESCDNQTQGPHTYLSIRFNATGLAKEVLIYKS
ncbi:hypothetical protein [Fulvivirga ligni]|uniref:hypothetical protein n=1 Tax=Fulvivirga ligni TaxID=2904246 RepID=UPI001F21FC20|nr:hypothetical protein [Fulvivirga ligni]UII19062.1 hypothetical protein LVD16_14555 [Fulvivirga ligni]